MVIGELGLLYGLWEGAQRHISGVPYTRPDQIYRPDVCGIRRQPMFHNWSTHLTSSLLSGELDSYDAEPEGVNDFVHEAEVDSSSSFVPRH